MKRIAILALGFLLVSQTGSCKREVSSTTAKEPSKTIYADEFLKDEGGIFSLWTELAGSEDGDSGWNFYLSDGKSSLAFKQTLASQPSEWSLNYFSTPKPPDYLDFEKFGPVSFALDIDDAPVPLQVNRLIPEMAEPARKAMSLARKTSLSQLSKRRELSADERRAWDRAAEGKFTVYCQLGEWHIIRLHTIYFGAEKYPAISIYRNLPLKGSDCAGVILMPDGFIATWGEGIGSDIAFYKDRVAINSHYAEENEPDITKIQIRCADSLTLLLSIVKASGLLEQGDIASMAKAIETLRGVSDAKSELRSWAYEDDLYLQLVRGQGVSPPIELTLSNTDTDSPDYVPDYIEIKKDGLYVYCSKPDTSGIDIIIEGNGESASPGLRPSGLLSGYLDGGEGGKIFTISLTDTVLARLPNADEEKAVSSVSELAKRALKLPEIRKLGKRHIDAFTRLAKRQMCIEARVKTTGMSAVLNAAGGNVVLRQAIPTSRDFSLTLRATADSATIDYQVRQVLLGDEESVCQLRLENGELTLINTGQDAATMLDLMRYGAEIEDKLIKEKLLQIPGFAAKQIDELLALAAEAKATTIKVVQSQCKISLLGVNEEG